MQSPGWPYKKDTQRFQLRDKALVACLYLGDLRAEEALPLTTDNFEKLGTYVRVKAIVVGKKKKLEYREVKFPLAGERACFTQLVLDYIERLKPSQRLFPWSLKKVTYQLPAKHDYTKKDGTLKHRYSIHYVGTTRAWQIINCLLPEYTQHWLRAFGYNFDYDNFGCDIMAVSDKTKADPRSLQPYLRRRYEKYPVR